MKSLYMVIIEEGPSSFSAYVPDLPSCVAVGKSQQEVLWLIEEAIEFHLERLTEEGKPAPAPRSSSAFIEIDTTQQSVAH